MNSILKRLASWAALVVFAIPWFVVRVFPADSPISYAVGSISALLVALLFYKLRGELAKGWYWQVLWVIGIAFSIFGGVYGAYLLFMSLWIAR